MVVRCKYGDFMNAFQIFFNVFFAFSTKCTFLPMKYIASFLKVANLTCFQENVNLLFRTSVALILWLWQSCLFFAHVSKILCKKNNFFNIKNTPRRHLSSDIAWNRQALSNRLQRSWWNMTYWLDVMDTTVFLTPFSPYGWSRANYKSPSTQIKASTNKMQKRVRLCDAFLHFFSI